MTDLEHKPASYPQRSLHRGYRYQDLVAAAVLARAVAEGFEPVAIESGRFARDRFDDITAPAADRTRRIQVKHSEGRRVVDEQMFSGDDGRLRIDDLVRGFELDPNPSVELRIFATWSLPEPDAALGFLIPADAGPLLPGMRSSRCHLDADALWPEGGEPKWSALRGLSRESFVGLARQLVLELEAPPMSGVLPAPGEFERFLMSILIDELGVDRHPNRRDPVDVAARLIDLAYSARTREDEGRRFAFVDIVRELGLIVDRGRVPQAFPLDRNRYIDAPVRAHIDQHFGREKRLLVTGPPGAGKSWALEALAEDLRAAGYIVARHYCFLEPGDPDVQERVALETMSANLIGELVDDPRLAGLNVGLAGDVVALGRALERAHERLYEEETPDASERDAAERKDAASDFEEERPRLPTPPGIVLIVDGLDHVARVEREAAGPSRPIDFSTSLASLELPDSATLIVGSQPGHFLEPLRDVAAAEIKAPPFAEREIAAQLIRLGVFRKLRHHGLSDERRPVLEAVVEQSAGNPLYGRFLGRQVLGVLADGHLIDPAALIRELPLPEGDLAAYYAYLLEGAEGASDAGFLAEHLAVIEFAVDVDDLVGLLPALGRRRVEAALRHLRPILIELPHGAARIHHESLRRFVIQRLVTEGRELAALLDPVIAWLQRIGFFTDERSFRFLLPSLRRAGRNDDVLNRLEPDFVARSVIGLHAVGAVEANLRVGARVAAERRDFAALARLIELRRAAATAYSEKLSEYETYAGAVIDLHGPGRFAERLLFEGRPVYGRALGLRLCALIDDAGGAAPWREYYRLPTRQENQPNPPEQRERESLDVLHAALRLRPRPAMVERILEWLLDPETVEASASYVRGVARKVRSVYGVDALREVLAETDPMPADHARWFRLELAEALKDAGEHEDAIREARAAVEDELPLSSLLSLLDLGVPAAELAERIPPPGGFVERVLADRHSPDEQAVAQCVTSALVHGAGGADLQDVRTRLAGEGWYRRWLRFVIDLGEAIGGRGDIVPGLAELAIETGPFVGKPRACDMYGVRNIVAGTVARAFALLPAETRVEALEHLLEVAHGTTTYLQGSPSGPLTLWPVLELLLPYADESVIERVERELEGRWRTEFYDWHAETSLLLARLWARAGDLGRAERHWRQAGTYLAGYGFHKDVTIFGLIEALEALIPSSTESVLPRLERLQPLVDRALYHSDGKETWAAPGEWFRVFAQTAPALAARSLAWTVLQDPRVPNSRLDGAFAHALKSAPTDLPPLARHVLWRCVPARADTNARLAAVEALLDHDRRRGEEAFSEAAAAIDGDTEHADDARSRRLREFAQNHALADPRAGLTPETRPGRHETHEPSPRPERRRSGPFLPETATPLELLVALRRERLDDYDAPVDHGAFASELADHVERLRTEFGEATVIGLLEDFSRRQYFSRRAVVLERLAEEFRERDQGLAAEIYTLAWCGTRATWDRFGGLEHSDLLVEAFNANRERAFGRLAREIEAVIDSDEYAMGVSRRIVEALVVADRVADGLDAWDAACEVVDYRLPATGSEVSIFVWPGRDVPLTTVRGYGELVGAALSHPVYERRGAALGALAELVEAAPELGYAAFELVLTRDASFTDTLIALLLLEGLSATAPTTLEQLGERLVPLAGSGSFALSGSARRLLEASAIEPPPRRLEVSSAPLVSQTEVEEALAYDYDDRARRLARLWSRFPQIAAGCYWRLWNSTGFHERVRRDQADVQWSRSSTWVLPLPLHDWRREIFERALDQAIPALRSRLIQNGRWNQRLDEQIRDIIAPDVAASAARARSRIVRPEAPLPRDRGPGHQPLEAETAGPYQDWTHLGFWERELVERDRWSEGTLVAVRAGVAGGTPQNVGEGLPWASPSGRFRWHTQRSRAARSQVPPAEGWHAQWWYQHDATAWEKGLTLREDVREWLGLVAAELPAPLDLVDEHGAVGAVYRTWWMRPFSYDYHPTTPILAGGVLLVRPDLVERLRSAVGELEEVVTVEREELRRRDE